MSLSSPGDPVVGDGLFSLDVQQGPSGTVAVVFAAPGGCRVPGQPLLCGEVPQSLSGALVFLGVAPIAGAASCVGRGGVAVPVPLQRSLCGGRLCVQGVVACISTTVGLGLTNALDLLIAGS